MGSWGQKAFENDEALDWLGDLNRSMRLTGRLEKDIKQKKYAYTTRAAIEYMIRSHKAGLFGRIEDLTPLAVTRIKEIKAEYSDPKAWAWDSKKPIPEDELKEIKKSIRQATADLNRQMRYLLKEQERLDEIRAHSSRSSISKTELAEQFEKLKKRMKKSRKRGKVKESILDVGQGELAEAYEAMKQRMKAKQKKKASKKKAKKKTKKKSKKKARKKR